MKRLMQIFTVVCCIALLGLPPLSAAEEYPTRTITIVVPLSSGSQTDLGARILASFLSKSLGQPVVVVNRTGGGGTVGGNFVATSKPDGHTLGFMPLSPAIPEVYSYFLGAPYTSKDLKPVSKVLCPVATLSVKGDAPWKSLKELVEYARKNPGMKYGTTGPGSSPYVMMVIVEKAEGVKFTNVTFPGDSEIVPAILGGHIPFGLPHHVIVKPHLESGDIRILALYLQKRFELSPNVPTFEELGYKIPYYPFFGVFAPKETPDVIIGKVDKTIEKIKSDPAFIEKVRNIGTPITYENTESFRKTIAQYKANLEVLFKQLGYVKQ